MCDSPGFSPHPRPLSSASLSKLHRLEYLDLSHNRLTAVPLGLPRTLLLLHLGRNQISHVDAERLRQARGLRYLLLQHNPLGSAGLPAGALRPLRHLHTLHLFGNGLERVPPALPRRLRALMLPHNRVAALGARDLAAVRGLEELSLAYNRLANARVHPRAFRRLRALRSLDLAGNELTRLPTGLPGGLRRLRLQRNQLRELEPEPLAGLIELRELSLAHNGLQLRDIGPGTWNELQALQVRVRPATPSPACHSVGPQLAASSLSPCRPCPFLLVLWGLVSGEGVCRNRAQAWTPSQAAVCLRFWTSATTRSPSCPPTCPRPWRSCICKGTASAVWTPQPSWAHPACVRSFSGAHQGLSRPGRGPG